MRISGVIGYIFTGRQIDTSSNVFLTHPLWFLFASLLLFQTVTIEKGIQHVVLRHSSLLSSPPNSGIHIEGGRPCQLDPTADWFGRVCPNLLSTALMGATCDSSLL